MPNTDVSPVAQQAAANLALLKERADKRIVDAAVRQAAERIAAALSAKAKRD